MKRMPTLFVSHGSPMHAVQDAPASAAWRTIAREVPHPRAVLIASAHWETAMPMLTGSERPETIHDFGGFPQELYRIRYPAPGAPDIAARAVALLEDAGITAGIDGCRGLDHGAWVPLRWMYPSADVPVVQLAIQPQLGAAHHVEVGRALSSLRDQGVLIIASGHVTHNLRDWMTQRGAVQPLPYVREFSEWLAARIEERDTEALVAYRDRAPGAARAHPTDEHFLPLFIAWGAADAGDEPRRAYAGYDGSALAMDAYLFAPRQAKAA
ncbi:MAG TPA: class III extradiol ring-cleavage dioxygenase [Casimicrobiaceae bacterium]|nr:class III extradiol ring-cleavage dioxygenase [Casimicrobiaceae bacterium]